MATWVSWCDDGVTVVCDRDECRDPGGYWWEEVVEVEPGSGRRLSPKDMSRAIAAHEDTHYTT